jgi:sugar lactone lactonase YvrE
MAIDAEGMLWIAHCGGAAISRWDPLASRCLKSVPIPARLVTSCAFGGPGLDDLYVTTAALALDADALRSQPHAGALFRLRPGVPGLPADEFAG